MVEHVAVLGVHVDHHAHLPGGVQHPHQRLIADAEHVDHEDLEARIAEVDQPRDLGQRRVAGVGDDDVEAVVDVGAFRGLGPPRVGGGGERLPRRLLGVIADGGDAAARRRPRLEVVGRPHAAHLDVEVGVDVDAARQHQQAGRVDLAAPRR